MSTLNTLPGRPSPQISRSPRRLSRRASIAMQGNADTSAPVANDEVMVGEERNAEGKKRLFSYFKRMNKRELRAIGRHWQRRANGNKDDYVLRNYRFVLYKMSLGSDMHQIIANNPNCPSFDDALRDMEMACLDLISPPSDQEVNAALSSLGDPPEGQRRQTINDPPTRMSAEATDDPNSSNLSTPEFTVSELARLIVILREDHVARQALFQLGQELSRTELDAGMSRDCFLKSVASRFNDSCLRPCFSFAGSVDDADPSEEPLCERPAAILKQYFQEARSRFTDFTEKWKASGQNDPERFVNFLPRRGEQLYAMSKRVYILFMVARMGTPDEDTFFVDLTSKVITTGGYEEGIPSSSSGIVEGDEESGSTGSRKRRRSASHLGDSIGASLRKVDNMLGQISSSLARPPGGSATYMYETPEVTRTMAASKRIDELMALLEAARERLYKAKDRPDDQLYLKIAQDEYNRLLKNYTAVVASLNGNPGDGQAASAGGATN